VPRIQVALAEAYRVLRPGGRLPVSGILRGRRGALLDRVYDAYSFNAIPRSARR
jgi:demethylmenaquinone methyltransferase/2-methoxy-6-polyprenyl-1,4-benzoquinol methylase